MEDNKQDSKKSAPEAKHVVIEERRKAVTLPVDTGDGVKKVVVPVSVDHVAAVKPIPTPVIVPAPLAVPPVSMAPGAITPVPSKDYSWLWCALAGVALFGGFYVLHYYGVI